MSEIISKGYIVTLKEESLYQEISVATEKDYISSKTFSTGELSKEEYDSILNNSLVESIEPDIEVQACGESWEKIRMGCIYNSTRKNNKNINADIFILDTGVQKNHPLINLVSSKSFIKEEQETDDFNGHGTMSAGCSSEKDVGISPGARIHSYKVLKKNGFGLFSGIISAIESVISFKKNNPSMNVIINLSLAGYTGTSNYNALDKIIVIAIKTYNITVIIAAGNNGKDASLYSPAHIKEAITVGSYNQNNKFSTFSNYGNLINILAPGESIYTTTLNSGKGYGSGTSFAAPYVAGAAALYLSQSNNKKPSDVYKKLKELAANPNNPFILNIPRNTPTTSLYIEKL